MHVDEQRRFETYNDALRCATTLRDALQCFETHNDTSKSSTTLRNGHQRLEKLNDAPRRATTLRDALRRFGTRTDASRRSVALRRDFKHPRTVLTPKRGLRIFVSLNQRFRFYSNHIHSSFRCATANYFDSPQSGVNQE